MRESFAKSPQNIFGRASSAQDFVRREVMKKGMGGSVNTLSVAYTASAYRNNRKGKLNFGSNLL